MSALPSSTTRQIKGIGSLYRRGGRYWWCHYTLYKKTYRESTLESDETAAEAYLRRRVNEREAEIADKLQKSAKPAADKRPAKEVKREVGQLSAELREKILQEIRKTGNPVEVALACRVQLGQVFKCLERVSGMNQHATQIDLSVREEFIVEVERRARAGLLYSLSNLEDPHKLGELSRKVLEVLVRQPESADNDGAPGGTIVHVNGPAQFNMQRAIAHLSDEQLVAKANTLISELKGDRSEPGAAGGDSSGDRGQEERPEYSGELVS